MSPFSRAPGATLCCPGSAHFPQLAGFPGEPGYWWPWSSVALVISGHLPAAFHTTRYTPTSWWRGIEMLPTRLSNFPMLLPRLRQPGPADVAARGPSDLYGCGQPYAA
ncbi:hypothetical protein MN608_09590 [Microdochium nivale]|nr:hypothetical protein MN608_09590 [Microdochium nivale]